MLKVMQILLPICPCPAIHRARPGWYSFENDRNAMNKRMLKAALRLAPLAAITAGALFNPAQVAAQDLARSPISLTSEVKIERVEVGANGAEKVKLFSPNDIAVVPGDKVLFTLQVQNCGAEPAAGFVATNPLPAPVRFTSVTEVWADVSVDGGLTWGKLANLTVKTKDAAGTTEIERAAGPEDVTHVRWVFVDPIAAGAKKTISYRGVVK